MELDIRTCIFRVEVLKEKCYAVVSHSGVEVKLVQLTLGVWSVQCSLNAGEAVEVDSWVASEEWIDGVTL